MILPRCQRQTTRHCEAFYISSSDQVLSRDVTTPRNSYAWNFSKLVTPCTLIEGLADGRFEQLTIGSMRKNVATELS